MKLIIHIYLVHKLRLSGTITILPLWLHRVRGDYCRFIICKWHSLFKYTNLAYFKLSTWRLLMLELVRNLVAHGDAREGKWRGNWRMEWVASILTPPSNVVYPAYTLKCNHLRGWNKSVETSWAYKHERVVAWVQQFYKNPRATLKF